MKLGKITMMGLGKIAIVSAAVFFAIIIAAYFMFTGPHRLEQYPGARQSPYRLPYTAGQTLLCVQSNRGIVSHRGYDEFAYDFAMPVGTDVRAARAGKVVKVVQEHDGHGYHWPNNVVVIQHEDGTKAVYAHIKKGGSRVAAGDEVVQGQIIAASGHVGNSMLPHLHFHVAKADGSGTLPVTFNDLDRDRGIPRMFKRYTSGNTAPQTPAAK